jgi:hypothetical protein
MYIVYIEYLVVECSSCVRHFGRANRVHRAIDRLVFVTSSERYNYIIDMASQKKVHGFAAMLETNISISIQVALSCGHPRHPVSVIETSKHRSVEGMSRFISSRPGAAKQVPSPGSSTITGYSGFRFQSNINFLVFHGMLPRAQPRREAASNYLPSRPRPADTWPRGGNPFRSEPAWWWKQCHES